MDIQLLSKMVGELILTNDEVGLPGLGTFVAGVAPASFSDRGFTINPPYRKLSFFSGEPSDDRLAGLYASSNDISVDDAVRIISSFVDDLKVELKTVRSVAFPGLGKMKLTKDGTLLFVSDADLDIFPEGFGLESVSLRSRDSFAEDLFDVVTPLPEEPAAEEAAVVEPEAAQEPVVEPAESVVEPAEPAAPEEPVPAAEIVPEPGVVSAPEEPAEPVAAPVDVPEIKPEPVETTPKKHTALWIVLTVVILAAVAFAAFLILAKTAPDFIDSLLYTREELEILRW